MTRLGYARYLQLIREEGERLAGAARDLHAAVPPCPGWDVREAVRHTASVYRHKVACMELMRDPEEGEWHSEPARDQDLIAWFRDSLTLLLHALGARRAEDRAYTWYPPEQTAGFWARRMALETVVHRADVEWAAGTVSPVAADLAVDGIDEVLRVFLAFEEYPPSDDEHLGVVAVDVAGSAWTVRIERESVHVLTASNGSADARLGGDAGALFLYLWGRAPLDGLRREGDPALVDTLRRRLAMATQ